jgi:hypothetical protein
MKKLLCVCLCAAIGCLSVPVAQAANGAKAKIIKKYDTNGDGKLDEKERAAGANGDAPVKSGASAEASPQQEAAARAQLHKIYAAKKAAKKGNTRKR